MKCVAVDILGPFPTTDQGNCYILVAMYYFTKWLEAYAVSDRIAAPTSEPLNSEMFCRFGMPEELNSNQGRNFEAGMFSEVCWQLGIRVMDLYSGLIRITQTGTERLCHLTPIPCHDKRRCLRGDLNVTNNFPSWCCKPRSLGIVDRLGGGCVMCVELRISYLYIVHP